MSSPEDGRRRHSALKDYSPILRDNTFPSESVLERFRKLTGSLKPIPKSYFPGIMSKRTGISLSTIRNNSDSLLHHFTDSDIAPDLCMFIVDRLQRKGELEARFGWENISVQGAASVLTAFQPETNFINFDERILQEVLTAYPSLSHVLRKGRGKNEYSVPSNFFSDPFDQLFPGNEGKNIEAVIRKTVEQYKLTPLEYTILLLKASGKENEQIRRKLETSYHTVKNHVTDIMKKLRQGGLGEDLSDISQATVRLFKENLLPKPVLQAIPKYNYKDLSERLTPTELQILKEVASGKNNKEIAAPRNLSIQTVRNHMTSIMRKLDCHNRIVVSLVYLLADRAESSNKDITSEYRATERDSQEMLNLQANLHINFGEIYQILRGGYSVGRNKAVATRLSSAVGKVIAIGMKEFSLGLTRNSSFYRWYSEWSKLQSLATAMGYKVEKFKDYCKKYENIEVRNFLDIALRKHVDDRERGIEIFSKRIGRQPRRGVLYRG